MKKAKKNSDMVNTREKVIFVYVTAGDLAEGEKIATLLLTKRLIACANFFPMRSVYSWEGKIRSDSETVVILKTMDKHYFSIVQEIERIHSYEVPCICKIEVSANKEFAEWVKGMVN